MSKKVIKIIGIVFLSIFVLFMVYLGTLGMFNSVDTKQASSQPKLIFGKKYSGSMKSEGFHAVFAEVGQLFESGDVKGNVCGWYLNNPKKTNGQIDAIIGLVVEDSIYSKEGFSYYTIPAKKVVQAYVNADFKIAAAKTYSAINKFAQNNNLKLKEEYFEWYESKEDVYVEVEILE